MALLSAFRSADEGKSSIRSVERSVLVIGAPRARCMLGWVLPGHSNAEKLGGPPSDSASNAAVIDLVIRSPFAPAVHQLPQDARAQRHLAPVLLMPHPRPTPRRRRRTSLARTQHPRRGPRRVRLRSRPRRSYRAVSTTGRRTSRRAHPAHPGRRATRRRTRTIRPQDRQRDREWRHLVTQVSIRQPARNPRRVEFRLIRTPGSGETHCLAARTSPTGCPPHVSR
jgi:hypothetical protein